MAIQPLTRVIVENHENGTQLSRLPNNQEMLDKINEIVHFVNSLETRKANKRDVNPFIPRNLR